MDSATASVATTTTTTTEVTQAENTSEDTVEYGPHLPDNYTPSSDHQTSSSLIVSDVSSRKRAAMDDESSQDIDNMLDDALEVKRPRLDEGGQNDGLLCSVLQLEWLIMHISC